MPVVMSGVFIRCSYSSSPVVVVQIVHELIERFDGHLKAEQYYSVIANMRGESAEQVATLLMTSGGLVGLQGPTISSVYSMDASGTAAQHGFYAATICVPKKKLYAAVKSLQKVRAAHGMIAASSAAQGCLFCCLRMSPQC